MGIAVGADEPVHRGNVGVERGDAVCELGAGDDHERTGIVIEAPVADVAYHADDPAGGRGELNSHLELSFRSKTVNPHDIPQAVELLRKKADAGFAFAMDSPGLHLVNNPDRASKLIRRDSRATRQGGRAGMRKSLAIQGVLAGDGKLVPFDSKSAYLHFRIAALQGGSVGQSVIHIDIMVPSAKLGSVEAASLDSEASARVREHHTVLEIVPTEGANRGWLSGYALSV